MLSPQKKVAKRNKKGQKQGGYVEALLGVVSTCFCPLILSGYKSSIALTVPFVARSIDIAESGEIRFTLPFRIRQTVGCLSFEIRANSLSVK